MEQGAKQIRLDVAAGAALDGSASHPQRDVLSAALPSSTRAEELSVPLSSVCVCILSDTVKTGSISVMNRMKTIGHPSRQNIIERCSAWTENHETTQRRSSAASGYSVFPHSTSQDTLLFSSSVTMSWLRSPVRSFRVAFRVKIVYDSQANVSFASRSLVFEPPGQTCPS